MPLYGNSYPLLAPDGTAAAPVYSFGSAPTTGLFASSGQLRISVAGTDTYRFGASQFQVLGSSAALGLNGDVILIRDAAANILALRNSTSAQTFRVYNTYDTGGTNYERAVFAYESNTLVIGTEQAGTGATRGLTFRMGGTNRWSISSSSHLLAVADNTYDIGASGATRPRTIYVGTSVISAQFAFPSSTKLDGGTDGILLMRNAAGTDFTRLQFGGTTSSFPALKRSSAALHVRLADDSSYADLVLSSLAATSDAYIRYGTAIPAGGTAGTGYKFSSTANFGVFFGSGLPTLQAAKGSLYLRSDGSTTNDRVYVNTDGATAWTAITTAT